MLKLSNEQIYVIEEWLKNGIKEEKCPSQYGNFNCDDCRELFPEKKGRCPCNRHGVDYVIKKCKKLLEEQANVQ